MPCALVLILAAALWLWLQPGEIVPRVLVSIGAALALGLELWSRSTQRPRRSGVHSQGATAPTAVSVGPPDQRPIIAELEAAAERLLRSALTLRTPNGARTLQELTARLSALIEQDGTPGELAAADVPRDIDLRRLVDDVLTATAVAAQRKGLKLTTRIELTGSAWVRGLRQRLLPALTGLVACAIRNTAAGAIVLRLHSQKSTAFLTRYRFAVIVRGESCLATAPELELFPSPQLLRSMGSVLERRQGVPGEVHLAFSLLLEERPLGVGTPPPRDCRVLLVGIDPADRRQLGLQLQALSVGFLSVPDCDAALEHLLATARPNALCTVVLIDRDAAGVAEFCARLRAEPALQAAKPVLLTTALHPEDLFGLMRSGFCGHLTRPVLQAELLRCLCEVPGPQAVEAGAPSDDDGAEI